MTKTYLLDDLGCANCAAKMEAAIKKLPGVTHATVSFITSKLTIITESDDQSAVLKEAAKIIKKIEPDCSVVI